MKTRFFLSTLFLCTIIHNGIAQTPSLGSYPNTVLANTGGNGLIAPSTAPGNVMTITASAPGTFKGLLQVNPVNGVVSVTNAQPAGTYQVTVKAFNGSATAVTNFSLTVNNANCSQALFSSGGTVPVGGGVRASIAIGDFDGNGKQDVVTTNYDANSIYIRLGNGTGGFTGSTNIAIAGNPAAIAVGDVNGDGRQDITVARYTGNAVSVLLGDGAGNFTATTSVPVGTNPGELVLADFNNDGLRDIATTNMGSNTVSIRLGTGSGSFVNAPDITSVSKPYALTVTDFNNDGHADIAVTNNLTASVSILLGDGAGGFVAAASVSAGANVQYVVTGDFNHDNNQDLAVSNNYSTNSISVRFGNGAGGFTGPMEIPISSRPSKLVSADFNGDGHLDIACGNGDGSFVSILSGNGAGGFTRAPDVAFNYSTFTLAAGDFNNNGILDFIAYGDYNGAGVRMGSGTDINVEGNTTIITDGDNTPSTTDSTEFGNLSGTTKTYTIQNLGFVNLTISNITITGADSASFSRNVVTFPFTLAPGGIKLFTVKFAPASTGLKNATINIFSNDCDEGVYDFAIQGKGTIPAIGTYTAATAAAAGMNIKVAASSPPSDITSITAYTHTSFKGVLKVDPVTGTVSVINPYPAGTYIVNVKAFNGIFSTLKNFTLTVNNTNCSQGVFAASSFSNQYATQPASIAIGDFNNDDKQDFGVGYSGGSVYMHLGNGLGGTDMFNAISTPGYVKDLVAADFNGDGYQDFAATGYNQPNVTIYLGNAGVNYAGLRSITTTEVASSLAVGDFNNDGKQDLAVPFRETNSCGIWLGNGSGEFVFAITISVGARPNHIAIGDFNNDGNQDFLTANTQSATVSVRLGNGLGGFSAAADVATGYNTQRIVIADFNKDGNQDFVSSNTGYPVLSVRLGNGSGGFTNGTDVVFGDYQYGIQVADFNGDGFEDIAVPTLSPKIVICLGDGSGAFPQLQETAIAQRTDYLAVADLNNDGRPDLVASGSQLGTIFMLTNVTNEIEILGNNIIIADGDTIASASDFTDFGGGGTVARTFTIRNTGAANLRINNVRVSGIDSSLFTRSGITLPAIVAPGATTSFAITFTPAGSFGIKSAVIRIDNDDCDEGVYDFAIKATYITPPVAGSYPATSVVAGSNATIASASPPANTLRITVATTAQFKGLLTADPVTGTVMVSNASPAGIYPVKVVVFNGNVGVATTFNLTVTNTVCSQGMFAQNSLVTAGADEREAVVGDFNGDGWQDLAIPNYAGNTISIRQGDGSGNFSGLTDIATGLNPCAAAAGDFNGDGKQDLAVANFTSGNVSILLGNGNGGFSAGMPVVTGTQPNGITTGDFNNDDRLDFAVSNGGNNTVSIRLGDGTGSFTGTSNIGTPAAPFSIATSDFNKDGKADLAVALFANNVAWILYGNGFGGISSTSSLTVTPGPKSVVATDINNDGAPDIITANAISNSVNVVLGNGAAGFSTAYSIVLGTAPQGLATGDFNGDGKQDFVVVADTNKVVFAVGDGSGHFLGIEQSAVPGNFSRSLSAGDFNRDGRLDLAIPYSNTTGILLGVVNEINILGNNASISSGDTSTTLANHTDFGSTALGTPLTRTFTIQNTGANRLRINNITVTGADSASFVTPFISVPYHIMAGASRTFTITFSANTPGLKKAVIRVSNSDCDEAMYRFSIQALVPPGAALHFDGIDDYISVNDTTGNIDTGRITLSAWIKTTAATPASIISKRNACAGGNYFDFGINASGHLSFALDDNGLVSQLLTGSFLVNDGLWHQVVAVRKDSVLSLYVDGVLDSTKIFQGIPSIHNNAPLQIGANACGGTGNFFNGAMDEVRLWSKALSPLSIQNSLNCELANGQSGLLAYYKFNQGIAADTNTAVTTLDDSSGNGNNGILHNFTLNGSSSNWIAPGGVVTGVACANINSWLGANPDWNNAANWSGGYIPTDETNVVINAGMPFMPEVSNPDAVCFSLRLNNGATVTVKSSGRLNIVRKN
ncbi:MAG: FG-GAP-like repeat-containing protein [Bacteroidota bacterium]